MGDHEDITEIQQNLHEYEEQLVELRALLKESDEDAAGEIQAVIKDLEDAVELSKELLETAKQRKRDPTASINATGSSSPGANAGQRAAGRRIEAAITEAPQVSAPAVLGAEVKRKLRERQQRLALEGTVEPAWAIGATVRVAGDDGPGGREGVVRGVSEAGLLVVTFTAGGVEEEAEYEARGLEYFDDALRQNDERRAMQSLARWSGTENDRAREENGVNEGTPRADKASDAEKKRKRGDRKANTGADKITNSWQSFKAGKKVSKKMKLAGVKKESTMSAKI